MSSEVVVVRLRVALFSLKFVTLRTGVRHRALGTEGREIGVVACGSLSRLHDGARTAEHVFGIVVDVADGDVEREKFDPKAPVGKQFSGPMEFVRISNDGLVYVSDRDDHRIQVFTKEGRFVQELILVRDGGVTFKPGSFTFSRDPDQKYLIVTDGNNHILRIINRKDGSYVAKFGSRGRNAGQFDPELIGVDLDSKGNLYTLETKFDCRAQKVVPEK